MDLSKVQYDNELAFIQRINDVEYGNTVFICAGLGSSATYGSARYLAENWGRLQRKYRDGEFGICLKFPGQDPNDEFVVQPEVIHEFS